MFRVISFNANGIRSAARKGFFEWLSAQEADAVCVQETKAQEAQLLEDQMFFPLPHCFYHDALKKGYSGTALYLRHAPLEVRLGLGWPEIDEEGRYLEARYDGFSVVSLYMHSGSSGDVRQERKEAFMAKFLPFLRDRVASGERLMVCGDFNIAHTQKDIKNWKGNLKNSGFLPHERAWIDDLLQAGFVDAFRLLNQEENEFTWWSNRGRARENNVGWRIDYQMVDQALAPFVRRVSVFREARFSDHAPLIVDYDLPEGFL